MTAPLHPQPAPAGGAPEDHYCTPPARVQGPSEPRAGAAAARPSRRTTPPTSPSPSSTPPSSAATGFPLFGRLPPEIRLQVWRAALPPRTLELHSGRSSAHHARSAPAPWHSSSANPPPLAACAEARHEGLRRYYTVALPVVAPAGLRDVAGKPLPRHADPALDDADHHAPRPASTTTGPERCLYLDPRRDTLVVLGALEYGRLEGLRAAVARQDVGGLRRLALTTGGFTRGSVGPALRVWARVVGGLLAGLDNFTLLLHDAPWPPEGAVGGRLLIVPCTPSDRRYAAFATRHRRRLGAGDDGWIVVGAQNRRMDVARLEFVRADGGRLGGWQEAGSGVRRVS